MNGEVDRLAGRARGEEFSHVQNQANAIRFRHVGNIQVITSTGSIAGRILKRLPELITMERGMPALQKATQMTDEAMKFLDDEATLRGALHFGVTMYSVSHWAKFYTYHWYTAKGAYKFGLAESTECVEKIYKGRSCNTQRFTITRIITTLNTLDLDRESKIRPKTPQG